MAQIESVNLCLSSGVLCACHACMGPEHDLEGVFKASALLKISVSLTDINASVLVSEKWQAFLPLK